MSTLETQVEELIDQYYTLDEDDPQGMKILERAIKLAEKHKDIDLQFEAKMEYVEACLFCDKIEIGLTVFPWLLGMAEQYPERFAEHEKDLLENYKWVIATLPIDCKFSYDQMESIYQDFEKFYLKKGYAQVNMDVLYRHLYFYMAEKEKVLFYDKRVKANEHEIDDECEACLVNRNIEVATLLGDYEEAIRLAQPILQGKVKCTVNCNNIPMFTYNWLVFVYLKTNRWKELEELGERFIKESEKPAHKKDLQTDLILYYWATGQHVPALRYLERFIEKECLPSGTGNVEFSINTTRFLKELMDQNTINVKIKLPESHPLYKAENEDEYLVVDLYQWFFEESALLCKQLDERNRNDHHYHYRQEVLGFQRPLKA